jgi:hypothetical protein
MNRFKKQLLKLTNTAATLYKRIASKFSSSRYLFTTYDLHRYALSYLVNVVDSDKSSIVIQYNNYGRYAVNVVKSFVKANGEDLKRVPPMTSGETQLILGAVESTYREDVSEVLMPYMVGSQEGPVLR